MNNVDQEIELVRSILSKGGNVLLVTGVINMVAIALYFSSVPDDFTKLCVFVVTSFWLFLAYKYFRIYFLLAKLKNVVKDI